MKSAFRLKILKHFLLLSSILLFVNCQMTEKLTVNEDGSGKISFQVDASMFMQMMGKSTKIDKDKKNYDTIINFKDIIEKNKDSIKKLPKEKQKRLKKLEKFNLRIQMNKDSQKMNFEMFTNFKKVKELTNMLNSFQDGFSLASKTNKQLPGGKQTNALNKKENTPTTKVNYSYSKKSFNRTTKILDPEKLKKEVDSIGGAKTMFATSKYKLIYTFSKPIKKASIEDAFYSGDRKTITIEKGFIEFLSNPKSLDFSVEFEK